MKFIALVITILAAAQFSTPSAAVQRPSDADLEAQLRARDVTIAQLVTQLRRLKASPLASTNKSAGRTCEEERQRPSVRDRDRDRPVPEVNTVPVCTRRGATGACYEYGADEVGRDIEAVPNCTRRGATGTCYEYGTDQVGRDIEAVPNCTRRGATGTCYEYGADHIGRDATCVPNCTRRGATGTCYEYGPDICT